MNSQTVVEAKPKHAGGRPSKYDPDLCQKMVDYFSVPVTKQQIITIIDKAGNEKTIEKTIANELPLFQSFLVEHGLNYERLNQWQEKYPEFHDAYKKAKLLQEAHLIRNGIAGRYDTAFAIFTAKNITTLRDKVDIDIQQDIRVEVIGYDPDVLPPTKSGNGKRKKLPKAHIIDV